MTGGYAGSENLATTETLAHGDDAWIEVGSLPVPMRGLRGVSFNNKIIMTGKEGLILEKDNHYYQAPDLVTNLTNLKQAILLSSSGPCSHILNGQTSQRETQIS